MTRSPNCWSAAICIEQVCGSRPMIDLSRADRTSSSRSIDASSSFMAASGIDMLVASWRRCPPPESTSGTRSSRQTWRATRRQTRPCIPWDGGHSPSGSARCMTSRYLTLYSGRWSVDKRLSRYSRPSQAKVAFDGSRIRRQAPAASRIASKCLVAGPGWRACVNPRCNWLGSMSAGGQRCQRHV